MSRNRSLVYDGDDYLEGGEFFEFRSEEDKLRDRKAQMKKHKEEDSDEEEDDYENDDDDDEEEEEGEGDEEEEEEEEDEEDEEEDDTDESDDERKKAIQTLKDVSFGDILELRRRGDTENGRNRSESSKPKIPRRGKHSSKPPEFSSKAVVGLKRNTPDSETKRAKARDPRFEAVSGSYNQGLFDKAYGFLNDYRDSELTSLRESLKKERDPNEKARIETALHQLQQQIANKKRSDVERKRKSEWRKKEQKLVADGKKPFYLSKAGEKKVALEEKFQSLKKSNQLNSYIAKRTKRVAQKTHTKIPRSRRIVDAAPFSGPTKKRKKSSYSAE